MHRRRVPTLCVLMCVVGIPFPKFDNKLIISIIFHFSVDGYHIFSPCEKFAISTPQLRNSSVNLDSQGFSHLTGLFSVTDLSSRLPWQPTWPRYLGIGEGSQNGWMDGWGVQFSAGCGVLQRKGDERRSSQNDRADLSQIRDLALIMYRFTVLLYNHTSARGTVGLMQPEGH